MLHRHRPRAARDDVDAFCAWIGVFEIERRWRDLVAQGEDGEDRFEATGCAEQMAGGRFRRAHRDVSVAAEQRTDGAKLALVAGWRRGRMRVQVLQISGRKA